MSSFKPIDPKRDEIRRYLERGNVMESLTKLFIRVIKERPENPMEYIQNNIGVVRHQHDKYERLQKDLQNANGEIERLREIIKSINPEALERKTKQTHDEPQETQSKNNAVNVAVETDVETVAETKGDNKTKQQQNENLTTADETAQPNEAQTQTPAATATAAAASDNTATNVENPALAAAAVAVVANAENPHVVENQTPSAQKEQNDNNAD